MSLADAGLITAGLLAGIGLGILAAVLHHH